MKHRILYLHDGKMNRVGLDLVVHRQIEALVLSGEYQVTLVARGSCNIDGVEEIIVPHTWANLISFLDRKIYYDAKKRAMVSHALRVIKKAKPTFSAMVAFNGGLGPLVRESEKLKIPLFINVAGLWASGFTPIDHPREGERDDFWPRISQSSKRYEYHSDQVHALTPSHHCSLLITNDQVDPSRVHLIERGVDLDKFSSFQGKANPSFRLLFCGQLDERKGAHLALDAWLRSKVQGELWFMGSGSDEDMERLKSKADDTVKFLGFQEDVASLMLQCSAQILLSVDEGQAKSLLEGAACGLVTLGTAVTGFPFDGAGGFILEREDVETVAKVISHLASDRERLMKMQIRSSEYILAHYGWDQMQGRFLKAIKNVLL